MDEGSKILSASRVIVVVRGVRFEMRRWNAARAAEAFGAGVLGMTGEDGGATVAPAQQVETIRRIFEACAISPKPGDAVTYPDGTQAVLDARDFDEFATEVVDALLSASGGEGQDFEAGPADAAGPS